MVRGPSPGQARLLISFVLVTAETNAGDIPITGIPFSVNTNLLGLESLNARPTVVSNLDVFRGFSDYLQINGQSRCCRCSRVLFERSH